MNVKDFRELVKDLDVNTKVLTSSYTKEYIKNHPEDANVPDFQFDGNTLMFVFSQNELSLDRAPSIREILSHKDHCELSLDVEDGFVWKDAKEIIYVDGRVILL